jgi:spore germination protein KC
MLSGDAQAAALPWIELNQGQGGNKPSDIRLNGTAVFKKDKMVGYIDDKVTRGVLWVRNEIELPAITIEPKEAEGAISFILLDSNTKLIPKITDGTWEMTIKVVTEDDIVQNGTNLNVMNPEVVKKLQKQLEKDLENRIQLALDKVQKEIKADIFGFAEVFHRQYPNEWEKVKDHWDEKFPQIEVKIDSEVHIKRPGMSTTPQGLPEKEVKQK